MNETEFAELWNTEKVIQEKGELFWLVNKVQKTKPKIIVEIGVLHGGTLRYWKKIAQKEGLIIGIDKDPKTPEKMAWWNWQNKNVHLVIGDSVDPTTVSSVKEILRNRPIDFLYIDGWHDALQVFREFTIYGEWVRYGGLIGFDLTHTVRYFVDTIRGHQERCILGGRSKGTGLWYKDHCFPVIDPCLISLNMENRLRKVWGSFNFDKWKDMLEAK